MKVYQCVYLNATKLEKFKQQNKIQIEKEKEKEEEIQNPKS
jgi:hypothetical protein